jgi:hypothetical protein
MQFGGMNLPAPVALPVAAPVPSYSFTNPAPYDPMFSTEVASAAASAGISPEQLFYLSATANQTSPSPSPFPWQSNQTPYEPVTGTLPEKVDDVIEEVDMDVDSDFPVESALIAAPSNIPVTVAEAPSPSAQQAAAPVPDVKPPAVRPVAPKTAPKIAAPKRAVAPKAPAPKAAAPRPIAPKKQPIAPTGPKSDPKLVIDFGADDSSDDDGQPHQSDGIDEGINSLFASAKAAAKPTEPDTPAKLKEMAQLRTLIAQKEKELEEKRRSSQPVATKAPAPATEPAVVKRANAKPLKKASPLGPPDAKRPKLQTESNELTKVQQPVDLNQVKNQVSSVLQKEDATRLQLQQLESAQLDLVSLQRSMLACKSERTHMESRIKILEDHLKQARQLFSKVVAKEQTLQMKLSAAEKKVADRRRGLETAESNLSIQRIQLQETEIDLGVRAASLEANTTGSTSSTLQLDLSF